MRTAGIRNTPVDRRYLSDKDKSDYNNSGEYGKAAQAVARARAYRGREAYQRNRMPNTQGRTPGTGGFTVGLGAQQARNRQIGAQRNKQYEGLERYDAPSSKGDMFNNQ